MEIIVKNDILEELQSKGLCHSKEQAEQFLNTLLGKIAEAIASGKKVHLEEFGSFVGAKQQTEDIYLQEQLISKVVNNTTMDEERVTNTLHGLLEYIKDSILKGLEVQIIGFASFRLEDQKAQIIKDPRTGRKTIIPTKKVLRFESDELFCQKSKQKQILFETDEVFTTQISRLRTAAVLLVIPHRDFFVKTLEFHFEKAGWKTHTAQTYEEAKRYLDDGFTYLVLLDSKVENHQKLCEEVKCRRENRLIPLIIIYPKDTDTKRSTELKICGDEYVIEPFEIKHLLTVADSVLRRSSEEEAIFDQEVIFQLPTVDKYIEKANELAQRLFKISGLSEDGQLSISTAFREALGNAGQHGNKHREDKMLEVLYILDKEKITIAITDSGFGFDWQKYLDLGRQGDAVGRARQRYREGRLGGLGIMLMLKCVDRLEYNDTGNVITITKYLKKK